MCTPAAEAAPDSRRYRILHKLGFGSYSHAWFGQDLSSVKSVASLKFVASQSTEKSKEVEINEYLASRPQQDLGFRNFLACLDTFQVDGPNGFHNVIVTDQ
ncbi:hypothetical protein FB451DRAFT_1014378 [Mycena latifolia]|nr:hypothetical protein FB451DRAFT_1014378 [Mycena latifolia]